MQEVCLQYIGETENALHIRMNGRHSDIKTRKMDKLHGHSPLLPTRPHHGTPGGIEKIHRDCAKWTRKRESYWIFTLRTLPDRTNLDE